MLRKITKISIILILTGIFLLGIFILSIYLGAFGRLPDREYLLEYKNKTASLIVADGNELIGKIFDQNRTIISYDQIPEHLKNALIATEDARFYEHQGIDSRSVARVSGS